LLVVAKQLDSKVIVSRVLASDGSFDWTYALDFTYSEAPMLIDYKFLSGQGHHSLATKESPGVFAIARLKINFNGTLHERK
jgi:hypothetical protein